MKCSQGLPKSYIGKKARLGRRQSRCSKFYRVKLGLEPLLEGHRTLDRRFELALRSCLSLRLGMIDQSCKLAGWRSANRSIRRAKAPPAILRGRHLRVAH